MPAPLPPETTLENANLGEISHVHGNIQLGDNQYVVQDTGDLLMAIREVRRRPNLPAEHCAQLEQWIGALEQPGGVSALPGIRYEFVEFKARLDGLERSRHERLKMWLNRSRQRAEFGHYLKDFCKAEETVPPLLFCLSGDAELDGTEDASAMLFDFHLSRFMQAPDGQFVRARRMEDPLLLTIPADATDAFERILRELLEKGFFDEKETLVQALQEDAFRHKHLMARCRVRSWTAEGLEAFFRSWLDAFTRHRLCPFVLMLEFADADCARLQALVQAKFPGKPVALLPPLAEIVAQDLTDFYDRPLDLPGYSRYRDLFDERSLTAADMPMRYRPAIHKLQLKNR